MRDFVGVLAIFLALVVTTTVLLLSPEHVFPLVLGVVVFVVTVAYVTS